MEDFKEEDSYLPEQHGLKTKLSVANYGFEDQQYELFCTLKKSIFDSIYSNAITYTLSPRNASVQSSSGCPPSILWLQNESMMDRKELLGNLILLNMFLYDCLRGFPPNRIVARLQVHISHTVIRRGIIWGTWRCSVSPGEEPRTANGVIGQSIRRLGQRRWQGRLRRILHRFILFLHRHRAAAQTA